ncbi:hypothetical protein [Peribacillus tepidiphilus]|jgi:chaperonin cofactor prefoldin|uniref:hypothetical protein n=1 Tax=Peribacillus tepidiphilus TaxID=2652445 RepID=UPI001292761F|nr:hypothetical protein [Peribacillus tepidiphilus]
MEDTLKQILSELQKMNQRIDKYEKNFDEKIDNLTNEMRSHFKHVEDKLCQHQKVFKEYIDDKTEALNKRVYTVETDIQRILRILRQ